VILISENLVLSLSFPIYPTVLRRARRIYCRMQQTVDSSYLPPFVLNDRQSDLVLGGRSRADQIEVSLNEDVKSKEGRKMKQGH
jgi:hypothetical protein